jgi:hypothetical protein
MFGETIKWLKHPIDGDTASALWLKTTETLVSFSAPYYSMDV